jgi:fatty acid-binding protein DegV
MDSRTVFAGQGLMALETLRRMTATRDPVQVRRDMDKISTQIHTYILPKDPLVALERSRDRGENSVGWTQAFIASALHIHPIICNVNDSSHMATKVFGFKKAAQTLFSHAQKRIELGLTCPFVTINYVGKLETLKTLPGYKDLEHTAKAHQVKIIPSMASAAGGIYTSVGSITLALATAEHDWASVE